MMGRPAKIRTFSAADVEADLKSEVAQHALLQNDLRDALLEGENTQPYRAALAATGARIQNLRNQLVEMAASETIRHRAIVEKTASEIAEESARRHAAIVSAFTLPPSPVPQGKSA